MYRRINTDERALWEETTYKVNAAYNKVPDVKTEVVYRAISAPSDSIRPIVEVKGDTAIDTQALPVRVLIRDQYKPDGDYDANTMGVWKVRLIQQKAYNETVALTDYAEASNGEAQFSVDLCSVWILPPSVSLLRLFWKALWRVTTAQSCLSDLPS